MAEVVLDDKQKKLVRGLYKRKSPVSIDKIVKLVFSDTTKVDSPEGKAVQDFIELDKVAEEVKKEAKAEEAAKTGFKIEEGHKSYIKTQFEKTGDMEVIIKTLYGEKEDMRSERAKAVRDFILVNCSESEFIKKADPIVLSDDQKLVIDKMYVEQKLGIGTIAKVLWPDKGTSNGSPEWTIIREYLEAVHDHRSTQNAKYAAKEITKTYVVEKINSSVDSANLVANKLSSNQAKCVEALKGAMKSARYLQILESYNAKRDRNLFEREFVRATWDKDDLNADEINAYITLCDNYVLLAQNSERREKLNELINSADGSAELAVKLTEAVNSQNKERHDCLASIEKLQKSLTGARSDRMKEKGQNKANLIAFFEAFKNAEERKRLMEIAALQRSAVEKEVERIESADEWLARVVGVSKVTAI